MGAWTEDELRRIDETQELEIAPVRDNGGLRRPTPIWVVRAGDDVYVRAAYINGSGWHTVARNSGRARISAGGVDRDVSVKDADDAVLGPDRFRLPQEVQPPREHRRHDHRPRAPRHDATARAGSGALMPVGEVRKGAATRGRKCPLQAFATSQKGLT